MPRKSIVKFDVEHLQVLDEQGKVDKELEPKLEKDQLLAMYRWMRLAREMGVKWSNHTGAAGIPFFAEGAVKRLDEAYKERMRQKTLRMMNNRGK